MTTPAPQTEFNIVTPTQDVNGNALTAGQITSYTVQIGGVNYSFPAPASWVPGSTQAIPFAGLSPAFVPTANATYTADIEAVDAQGVSKPSGTASWTQNPPPVVLGVPNAPTITGVS
jgi:hypothetical protein